MPESENITPHANAVDSRVGDVVCCVCTNNGAEQSPGSEGAGGEGGHFCLVVVILASTGVFVGGGIETNGEDGLSPAVA